MPWRTATVLYQRIQLSFEAQKGFHSISELACRYGGSRPTVHERIQRYEQEKPGGLANRSHRPGLCPHAIDPEIVARIL